MCPDYWFFNMRIISPSPALFNFAFNVLMKYLFVILLFLFSQVYAQYDPAKVNKKALKWYLKSQEQAREDQFQEGIESLKEAVEMMTV